MTMRKYLKKMGWINYRGKWAKEEIIMDILDLVAITLVIIYVYQTLLKD